METMLVLLVKMAIVPALFMLCWRAFIWIWDYESDYHYSKLFVVVIFVSVCLYVAHLFGY